MIYEDWGPIRAIAMPGTAFSIADWMNCITPFMIYIRRCGVNNLSRLELAEISETCRRRHHQQQREHIDLTAHKQKLASLSHAYEWK